ncbi:hypothetical protein [Chryseobacterium paludis]|uniref:hypothetical protein n=1 Tax=Chryseobacterium paludis TaxID=2956784 RepID=UPI0021C1747C|nr:hypothetical protein [Chryseobacterium paludis]
MSSIKCPKCQSNINDTITQCTNCGYFIKSHLVNTNVQNPDQIKKQSNGCGIVVLLFFGFLFLFFLIKQCSKAENNIDYSSKIDTKLSKEDSIKNQARIDSIGRKEKAEEEKFLKTKAGMVKRRL